MRGTSARCVGLGLGMLAIGAAAAMLVAGRLTVSPLGLAAGSRAVQRTDGIPLGAAETSAPARKLVALEQVLRATVDAVEAPREYWRDESSERRRHTEALIAAQARARKLLTERFGAAASEDPAFRVLFRPLDRRFPWMTSAQQTVIHDAELRFGASIDADPQSGATGFNELSHRLESELGRDIMFEYGVRTSPLSRQLRASGVTLDEPEFREAYALMTVLDEAEPAPDTYRDVRSALRNLLGSARFNALWAARDPRFATLTQVGKRHGLGDDTLMSAYAILNDAQDALLDAALRASGDARTDADRLRSLHDTSRARLVELVGADAARAILVALSLPRDARAAGMPRRSTANE